jgi:hypothetical protein
MVERDVEVFIGVCVQGVVFVAELLWGEGLLQGFYLAGGAVLVGAADVQDLVAHAAFEPGEYIC